MGVRTLFIISALFVTARLLGAGGPNPTSGITASPTPATFARTPIDSSSFRTIVVTNTSASSQSLFEPRIWSSDSSYGNWIPTQVFTVAGGNCVTNAWPITIASSSSCTLTLKFTPTTATSYYGVTQLKFCSTSSADCNESSAPYFQLRLNGIGTERSGCQAAGAIDSSFGIDQSLIIDGVRNQGVTGARDGLGGGFYLAHVIGTATLRSLMISRYSSFGHLDETFGNQGSIQVTLPTSVSPRRLFVQPTGKLVLAMIGDATPNLGLWLYRYSSNGAPDMEFGNMGSAYSNFITTNSSVFSMGPDGRITIVAPSGEQVLAQRFTTDGQPDAAFTGFAQPAGSGRKRDRIDPYYAQSFSFTQAITRGNGETVVVGKGYKLTNGIRQYGFIVWRSSIPIGMTLLSNPICTTYPGGGVFKLNATETTVLGVGWCDLKVLSFCSALSSPTTCSGSAILSTNTFPWLSVGISTPKQVAFVEDEKLLFAIGSSNGNGYFARTDGRGILDSSFGSNGIAAIESGGSSMLMAHEEGAIAVAFTDSPNSTDPFVYQMRAYRICP